MWLVCRATGDNWNAPLAGGSARSAATSSLGAASRPLVQSKKIIAAATPTNATPRLGIFRYAASTKPSRKNGTMRRDSSMSSRMAKPMTGRIFAGDGEGRQGRRR